MVRTYSLYFLIRPDITGVAREGKNEGEKKGGGRPAAPISPWPVNSSRYCEKREKRRGGGDVFLSYLSLPVGHRQSRKKKKRRPRLRELLTTRSRSRLISRKGKKRERGNKGPLPPTETFTTYREKKKRGGGVVGRVSGLVRRWC